MSVAKAIVTGGANGIGAATARALAERGHHVVVGDVDETTGQEVADQIGGTFARLEVSDPVAWDRIADQHGPFGVAVLNAGIGTGHPVAEDAVPIVDLPNGAYRRIQPDRRSTSSWSSMSELIANCRSAYTPASACLLRRGRC